jgi:hypothetical protein
MVDVGRLIAVLVRHRATVLFTGVELWSGMDNT